MSIQVASLWEILVPTKMMREKKLRPIRARYHRVWDESVRKITKGLTITAPAKGHWVNPEDGEVFVERMIPVRVHCTLTQIHDIADMTAQYYNQKAVMFYEIASSVTIKHYRGEK